jgi:PQQ-like domain
MLSGLMCACSSGRAGSEITGSPEPGAIPHSTGGPSLGVGAPDSALVALGPHRASSLTISRLGSNFGPSLSQRVNIVGDSAYFSPDLSGSAVGFAGLAYAIYSFNLRNYNGAATMKLNWDVAPKNPSKLWVGFANWKTNRWDWKPCPSNGIISFSGKGEAQHVKAGGGDLLTVVMQDGGGASALGSLQVGSARGGWWMFGADGKHTHRSLATGPETADLKWSYQTDGPGSQFFGLALGPGGTTYSCGPGESMFATGADGKLIWSHNGDILSATSYLIGPAFSGQGPLFSTSRELDQLYAHSSVNGALLWSYDIPNVSVLAPLAATDGTAYVVNMQNVLYSISPEGSLNWSIDAGSLLGVHFGVADTLSFSADGSILFQGEGIAAAFTTDGTLKWRTSDTSYWGTLPSTKGSTTWMVRYNECIVDQLDNEGAVVGS